MAAAALAPLASISPVALGLIGGGLAANVLGERQAAKERRNILNRAIERTDQTQKQATQQVLDEGSNYGQKRLDAVDAQQQSALAQSLKDIGMSPDSQGAGAQVIDTAGSAGNVSADFLKSSADKAISEGNRITQVARELAKVRAPGMQALDDSTRRADLTQRIASAAGTNRNLAEASQLDAQNVDTPWWGKLGKVASTLGSLAAAGGIGAAAPSAGIVGGVNSSAINSVGPRIAFG